VDRRLPERVEMFTQSAAEATLQRVQELRQRAELGFQHQRDRAADTLERLSRAVEFVGEEVEGHDERMARQLERTGERILDVAAYVSSTNPKSLQQDVTRLTRSRPAAMFFGSYVAGLMIGRFLRASQRTAGASSRRSPSTPTKGDGQ